jgi:hypothetical protein
MEIVPMLKKPFLRSLLQIAGLTVVALYLSTASPKAAPAFDECDDQFAQCQEHCGTSDYTWVYDDWFPDWCWNGSSWYVCGGHWEGVYWFIWTDHIDYFECRPGSGHGICMCSY